MAIAKFTLFVYTKTIFGIKIYYWDIWVAGLAPEEGRMKKERCD